MGKDITNSFIISKIKVLLYNICKHKNGFIFIFLVY